MRFIDYKSAVRLTWNLEILTQTGNTERLEHSIGDKKSRSRCWTTEARTVQSTWLPTPPNPRAPFLALLIRTLEGGVISSVNYVRNSTPTNWLITIAQTLATTCRRFTFSNLILARSPLAFCCWHSPRSATPTSGFSLLAVFPREAIEYFIHDGGYLSRVDLASIYSRDLPFVYRILPSDPATRERVETIDVKPLLHKSR